MTTETDKLVEMAQLFHDTYEALAPAFGYETRPDTKAFDPESPNGKLMCATVAKVRTAIIASLCGDVEPFVFEEYPYNSEAMGCGLEDRDITDRYEAMAYGWDRAMERAAEAIPDDLYPAHTVAALKSRADALAARVAELEKDARRLDAVERNRFELTPLEGGGWDVSQYHSETCDSQLFAVGELTARAAIDSAALAAKG